MQKKVKVFNYNAAVWGTEKPERQSLFSSGTIIIDNLSNAFMGVSGKVLDIGCGGGQFIRAIHEIRPDLQLTGVDIGKEAIAYAKKRSKKIVFLHADACRLPFASETFDGAYSIEVLEHVADVSQAVKEISRILKPKGVLYLSVNCEASGWTFQGMLLKLGIDKTSEPIGHVSKLDYETILKMLRNKGLIIKRISYFGHYLRQLQDIVYVYYLSKSGKKPGDLWETYKDTKLNLRNKFIFFMFQALIFLSNVESKVLYWYPGISIQIVAVKK